MMCFDEWSGCVLSNCGHFDVTPATRSRNDVGSFRLRRRHGIDIAEMQCRIDRIERHRAGIRRDDNEYLFLLLQRSGDTGIAHNGCAEILTPGDTMLLDSTRIAEMHFDGRDAVFTSVHLPRALCLEGRGATPKAGRRIGKSHPLHASLMNLLDESADDDPDQAADYLFDFIAMMFRAETTAGQGGAFRDRNGRYRFACETVERNLTEADFSIERLAALVNMSRRQLQRDFSDNGTTFTQFLTERRLRLVASHLRRAAQMNQRQPIAGLAYRVGFSDLSHFNRQFRLHYGMSPGEYHADCAVSAGLH